MSPLIKDQKKIYSTIDNIYDIFKFYKEIALLDKF